MKEESFGERVVKASLGADGKIDPKKLGLQALKYKNPYKYKLLRIGHYTFGWWYIWLPVSALLGGIQAAEDLLFFGFVLLVLYTAILWLSQFF